MSRLDELNKQIEELEDDLATAELNIGDSGRALAHKYGSRRYCSVIEDKLDKLYKERDTLISAQNDVKKKQQNNQQQQSQLSSLVDNYKNSAGAMNKTGTTIDTSKVSQISAVATAKNAKDAATTALSNAISGNSVIDISGTASTLTSTAENILGSATNLASSFSSAGLSAAQSVSSSVNSLFTSSKAVGTASQFANTIADQASGAASMVTGLVDKAGNLVNSFVGDALATATNMTEKINNAVKDAREMFTESADSIGKSGTANLESKTSFIATNNKKGISNALLPVADLGVNLSNLKNKAIDKFSELAGTVNTVTDAVNNVKSQVQGTIQNVTSTGTSILATITSPVTDTILSVKSTVEDVTDAIDPNNVKQLVQNTLGDLPFGLDDIIGTMAGEQAEKLQNKIEKVESKFSGITGISSVIANVSNYADSPSQVTDDLGKIVVGLCNGNIDKDDLDSLYKAATEICPNVSAPDYSSFGENKLAYSTLLDQAIESGCADLLRQLMNCDKYFDMDAKRLIADKLGSAARSGDPELVKTMLDATGTSSIDDPKKFALTLGTNIREESSDNEATEAYRTTYKEILEKLNTTPKELVSDDSQEGVYSPTNMALLARKPELLNSLGIENDTRNTVLNVYTFYAA